MRPEKNKYTNQLCDVWFINCDDWVFRSGAFSIFAAIPETRNANSTINKVIMFHKQPASNKVHFIQTRVNLVRPMSDFR